MCQFCVEHGEGERWYLNVSNYAYDLESDLKRREYIVDFIEGFGSMRSSALTWAQRLDKLPRPLGDLGRSAITAHMKKNHFGQAVPLEECERIFDATTSITSIPCICRMHTPGKTADEVCLLVTTQPVETVLTEGFKGYENGPDLDDFNKITKDEAMALLRRCEEQGLMHSVWTFQTPFTAAICNCNVESGCMAMRMTAGYGVKLMWRSEYVATLDAEKCTRCGRCAKVCPFGVIQATRAAVKLDERVCWGCGICRPHCRTNAITISERCTVPVAADVW